MLVTIQSTAAAMSAEEVLSLLTPEEKSRVKGKNIVAYTVAVEGQSKPKILGKGHTDLTWRHGIIRKIQASIKKGTKLFRGHNADNSTEGRTSLGEVVASFTKNVGGRLRAIAVATMEKVDAAMYDICSIEANIHEQGGVVSDVENITGIAVGSSAEQRPAFSEAKRMAIVQCFEQSGEGMKPFPVEKERNKMMSIEDLSTVPIELIRQTIRIRQMHPAQLFTLEDIEGDREFGEIVKKKTEAEARISDLTKLLEEKIKIAETAEKETAKIRVKDLFSAKLEAKFNDNKITKQQKDFIAQKFDPASFEKADEASVEKFFETSSAEFAKYAKIFQPDTENALPENALPEESDVSELQEAFLAD